MIETWRSVVGWEGFYEVSDQGRVRSVDRVVPHPHSGYQTLTGRILATGAHPKSGHLNVCLAREGKTKTAKVHHLVLEAFVGPMPLGMEGCHRDGDPTNNQLTNLRWDTKSGNRADAIRHGTHFNVGEWAREHRAPVQEIGRDR